MGWSNGFFGLFIKLMQLFRIFTLSHHYLFLQLWLQICHLNCNSTATFSGIKRPVTVAVTSSSKKLKKINYVLIGRIKEVLWNSLTILFAIKFSQFWLQRQFVFHFIAVNLKIRQLLIFWLTVQSKISHCVSHIVDCSGT